MACSGVPDIWGLGSYFEFLQMFGGKRSGLGGKGPGFSTTSLTFSKLLPSLALHSSSDKWPRKPSVPLPAFRAVVRNLCLLKRLGLQVTVCDKGLH